MQGSCGGGEDQSIGHLGLIGFESASYYAMLDALKG